MMLASTMSQPSPKLQQNTPTLRHKKEKHDEPVSSAGEAINAEQIENIKQTRSSGFILAFAALMVLSFMAAIDASALSNILPIISLSLDVSAIETFWMGTSFLLASSVFQLLCGSFSEIFGRKNMVYTTLFFFFVGSLVASLAKRGNGTAMMLAGRSVQGLGGGGILVLTEVIAADMVPLRERGKWLGYIAMMWSFGSIAGPLVGSAFAEKVTWRWIFWINFPFIAIGGVLIAIFLRLGFFPESTWHKLLKVDWVGSILFTAAATGFLVPLSWGGLSYPWSSWHTLAPLLISLGGIVIFVLWEYKYAVNPIMPLRIFQNRTCSALFVCSFIHGLILWCQLYYQPLYFQGIKGYSALLSSVAMLSSRLTMAPSGMATAMIIAKVGDYKWAIWIGWTLATLGDGTMIFLDLDTPIVAWVFINLVTGVGVGILFTAMLFGVMSAADEKDVAFAVSIFAFARAFGQTTGVAIGGVIFQNQLSNTITSYPNISASAAQVVSDSSAFAERLGRMADGAEKTNYMQSYADALKVVWATICALAGVALLLSLLVRHHSMDRKHETRQEFVEAKKKEETIVGA